MQSSAGVVRARSLADGGTPNPIDIRFGGSATEVVLPQGGTFENEGGFNLDPAPVGPHGQVWSNGVDPADAIAPDAITVRGGITKIPIAANSVCPAGSAAWFPLLNMDIGQRFGGEALLISGEFDQAPADVLAAGAGSGGAGSGKGWGDPHGEGAFIVVGKNLPVYGRPGVDGQWSYQPFGFPGLDSSVTQAQDENAAIAMIGFPPGNYNDALPYVRVLPMVLPGNGVRLSYNDRLCAALVIPKTSYDTGGAIQNIYGRMFVTLRLVRVVKVPPSMQEIRLVGVAGGGNSGRFRGDGGPGTPGGSPIGGGPGGGGPGGTIGPVTGGPSTGGTKVR